VHVNIFVRIVTVSTGVNFRP